MGYKKQNHFYWEIYVFTSFSLTCQNEFFICDFELHDTYRCCLFSSFYVVISLSFAHRRIYFYISDCEFDFRRYFV